MGLLTPALLLVALVWLVRVLAVNIPRLRRSIAGNAVWALRDEIVTGVQKGDLPRDCESVRRLLRYANSAAPAVRGFPPLLLLLMLRTAIRTMTPQEILESELATKRTRAELSSEQYELLEHFESRLMESILDTVSSGSALLGYFPRVVRTRLWQAAVGKPPVDEAPQRRAMLDEIGRRGGTRSGLRSAHA